MTNLGKFPRTADLSDPDTKTTLFQAQYLQEVLLRISSLLDNLHILSQMNERIEGEKTNPLWTRDNSLYIKCKDLYLIINEAPSTDDPRLRTILAFATLDPDNMTYEVRQV